MMQKEHISLFLLIWRKVLWEEKNKNDRIEEGKNEGETTDSVSTTVNNEELGGNVDIEDFYDIFGDLDEHITEDSIVWVKTKRIIWEGRVIKTLFSEKSEDAKNLKLIWINTKKEERVLIKHCPKEYKKGYLYQLRDTRMEVVWRNQCWM